MLGGEISFESELGKGSRFTAQLPWMKEQPHATSSLSARLDEMSKTQRVEQLRGAVGQRINDAASSANRLGRQTFEPSPHSTAKPI